MIQDLIKIDSIYISKKSDISYLNEYYNSNCNSLNITITKSFNLFKNEEKSLKFKKTINNLTDNFKKNFKIEYKEMISIKSDEDFTISILLFFIFKELISVNVNKTNENEISHEIKLSYSSDEIINNTCENIEKINLWMKNVLKKEKINFIEESQLRLCLTWILEKLNSYGIIIKKRKKIKSKDFNHFFINNELEYEIFQNQFIARKKFEIFEFGINQYYLYSDHYSTVKKIFKSNKQSGLSFTPGNRDLNKIYLENILNIKFNIDNKKLNSIIETLCEFHSLNRTNIEKDYKKILNFYRKTISIGNMMIISEISKEMAIYINIINLIKIYEKNDEEKDVYSDIMICFRGRTFFLSPCSLTFHKELRYCCYQGKYKEYYIENEEKNETTKEIEGIIEKTHENLNLIKNYNFTNESNEKKNSIIWILISIAEIEKSKFEKIEINDFIKMGINILNNHKSKIESYELENKLKLKYFVEIIEDIYRKETNKKWLISKDATASVFQHMTKILGPKNDDIIKWCNLNSIDTWYDTYSYIINTFKKKIKPRYLNNDDMDKIFSRKNLKSTIMTESYGAKKIEAIKKFVKKAEINNMENEEKKQEAVEIFQIFFDNLKKETMFDNNPTTIIEKIIKLDQNKKIIYFDKYSSFLTYKISKITQIEGKFSGVRITKKKMELTNIEDTEKIRTSARANYVQSHDASLVRWYYQKNNKGITIHDCFMVDYMEITKLISTINEGMNINFHDLEISKNKIKIFSIFIVL